MSIVVYSDRHTACTAAATLLAAQLITKPSSTLGLDYDERLNLVYSSLSAMSQNGLMDWTRVNIFQLCEYVGSSGIFDSLNKTLLDSIGFDTSKVIRPVNTANNWQLTCHSYEQSILKAGGLDMAILAIKPDGSILFNAAGADLAPVTHVDSYDTLSGVTAGMVTIMNAKKLVVLVLGSKLSKTARASLNGVITDAIPSSLLQLHSSATFILDEEAAALL